MADAGDLTEHELASKTVYRGRLLHVREDAVGLPDGGTATREYVVHPGAVAIIAIADSGKLILERQYRYALRRHLFELPAGKLEPGEDPLATAQRELLEETGYAAQDWRKLTTIFPLCAYSSEKIHLYVARGLRYVEQRLDAGEFLEVLEVSLEEGLAWIDNGRIGDAKTIIGLLWAERAQRSGW
jgi:ADP-ribose pyrophosphatase